MMNSSTQRLAFALASAALLSACGGGGGGSSPLPSGSGPTPSHAKLSAGFCGIGRGGSAVRRRPQGAATLAGSLVPIADFSLPDSYVKIAPISVVNVTALAYYDPASGAIPNPVPTVVWTEAGIPVTMTAPATPFSISGDVVAGQTTLSAPAVDGKATLTGTASNADIVTLVANSYRAAGISTIDPVADPTHSYGFSSCATFAGGVSTPGATGDVCVQRNSDGSFSIVAVNGGALIQKPIDAVTIADATSIPPTTSSLSAASITAGSGAYTLVLRSAQGALVKYGLSGVSTDWYGPYRIGSPMSGWDI